MCCAKLEWILASCGRSVSEATSIRSCREYVSEFSTKCCRSLSYKVGPNRDWLCNNLEVYTSLLQVVFTYMVKKKVTKYIIYYTYMHIYIHIFIHICIYMYIFMYMYIYIYIYSFDTRLGVGHVDATAKKKKSIYICMYIYIYGQLCHTNPSLTCICPPPFAFGSAIFCTYTHTNKGPYLDNHN